MAVGDGRWIKNAPNTVSGVIKALSTDNPIGAALTTPDAEVSIDGGAFADCTNEATDIGTTGHFTTLLTAAECTGEYLRFVQKCANAGAVYHVQEIRFEPCVDSGVAQASTTADIVLRTGASATNDFYNGCDVEIVRGTNAGQVRRITDYTGSSRTATVDRAWAAAPDTTSVYIVHPRIGPGLNTAIDGNADLRTMAGDVTNRSDLGTAAQYLFGSIQVGTVNDASPTTSDFDTSLASATDNFYQNRVLTFTIGAALRGISSQISTYGGGSKNVAMYPALPGTPTNGDKFIITGLFF